MLFHVTYKVAPGQRNSAQERFKNTGALPPDGVTLKGRWHSINGDHGFNLAETSDIEAFGKWIQEWSDILIFDVTPVVTDEQIAKIIG